MNTASDPILINTNWKIVMAPQQHLNTLNELRELLMKNDIFNQFSLSRIGVFGSFSRNEIANDIDLLIEDDLSLETALELKIKLESLVDNRMDVMLKSWANPIVLHRAMKDIQYVEG